jgi:Tol biopolymer transport system component
MTLPAGTRLGPYEILSPLGAGGMGEVYRARDERLGREVAIKVLPASFSSDPDRLKRFEQEARAAGVLNHPNVTIVHDIGSYEGAPYVVQELLEGETLRSELAGGRFSPRKAIDYATQIAQGLAAAHEKGIVHRDLKPENLFVSKNGRVKILDFGLAKLVQPERPAQEQTSAPTATLGTEPGVVMGTVGYMSPEQVKGQPVDHRSDIFSFGTILYEMLSGRRPFKGDSAAETMSAILKEDPPELSETNRSLSPSLDRLVRHCLEKNPMTRFQSARDLAYDLASLSNLSGTGLMAVPRTARRISVRSMLLALTVAAIPVAGFLGRRSAGYQPPNFRQLTFQRGAVLRSRYTPDGGSIIFGAARGGSPTEIYTARLDGTESHAFGVKNADVLAVSSKGEVAVLLKTRELRAYGGTGTLAVVPLAGGAVRELLEHVVGADWSPDGTQLAVVRDTRDESGEFRLEYPIGKVLYKSKNGFGLLMRVSGSGKQVAFEEFTPEGQDLRIVDTAGKATTLLHCDPPSYLHGPVWLPGNQGILLSRLTQQSRKGDVCDIDVVDLGGRVRTLYRGTGWLFAEDLLPDGRLLVRQGRSVVDLMFGSSKEPSERSLSWLTNSWLSDLSEDGKTLLFQDETDLYLRKTDGSPAVRLGSGRGGSLSRDGKWVLATTELAWGSVEPAGHEISMIPTGPGQVRKISIGELSLDDFGFMPDGKTILFTAAAKDGTKRLYVTDETGKTPRAVSEAGRPYSWVVSPDGKQIAVKDKAAGLKIYELDGGAPRAVAGFDQEDDPLQWSQDGRYLYVARTGDFPVKVERFDLGTGRKEPWKTLVPQDLAGAYYLGPVGVTRDGNFWAYSVNRSLVDDLWQVTGLFTR